VFCGWRSGVKIPNPIFLFPNAEPDVRARRFVAKSLDTVGAAA
jgi:hypothetical protein